MAVSEASPQLILGRTAADSKASAAPELTTTEAPALGLALSGGGVRAALFALGVVIGLIETGCHRRVRCVASVSGGSILNAVLAHATHPLGSFTLTQPTTTAEPLDSLSDTDFEWLATRLATSLAWRGVFPFHWRTVLSGLRYLGPKIAVAIVQLTVQLAIVLVLLVSVLASELHFNLVEFVTNFEWTNVPWRLVGGVALALVLLSLWLSRGLVQEAMYGSVLGALAGRLGRSLCVRDWGATSAKDGPSVMHVLVATDLLSGEPMYFSKKFVYCKAYGWSHPGANIRSAKALYSSAAFPAVYPPKKLRTRRLNFQNGDMPGELPRTLKLADGGVYNNLGDDWFDILKDQSLSLWPFGELDVQPPKIEPKNVIIVNASAPSRRVHRLGPFTLARIMSVLYDNTVLPRVKLITDKRLIDIAEHPLKLASTLAENDLIMKLKGRTDEFWADFGRDTAGTRTKLSPAGRRTAARLMLHGYLSSLVLLHAQFGGNLPKQIRGEGYFLKLVPLPGQYLPQKRPRDGFPRASRDQSSQRDFDAKSNEASFQDIRTG